MWKKDYSRPYTSSTNVYTSSIRTLKNWFHDNQNRNMQSFPNSSVTRNVCVCFSPSQHGKPQSSWSYQINSPVLSMSGSNSFHHTSDSFDCPCIMRSSITHSVPKTQHFTYGKCSNSPPRGFNLFIQQMQTFVWLSSVDWSSKQASD
jgi:hypothetical protein